TLNPLDATLTKTRGGGLDKLTSVPATQERREPPNSRGLPHSFTRYSARSSSECSTLGGFFLVLVLYTFNGSDRRACCGRFGGVMLVAGSPFDQSFFCVGGLNAMVARHAHDFRHDRQAAKFGANLVERQPKFRASGHSCRFHVADVPVNLRAGR